MEGLGLLAEVRHAGNRDLAIVECVGGVTGGLAFVRHAAPDAVAVAINSWGAHLSLNDAFASYCVAKMAVYRLWDTVAITHPRLSVFHTQPGVILTEMNLNTGGADSFKDVKTDDGKLSPKQNAK